MTSTPWRVAPGAIIAAISVAGCATTPPPPSRIVQPSARLMSAPEPAPAVKPGDDLVVEHLKLRRQYHKETSKLRSLQGYVKTLRGAAQ